MKNLVSTIILLAVLWTGIPATPGFCTGIPVFDASNMLNQLQTLLQQLKQYEEEIKQSTALARQYIQLLKDYEQKLREYQHYLSQIKSVQHMIKDRDWKKLLETVQQYGGKSEMAAIVQSDPKDPNYEKDMNTVLSRHGYVPRQPSEVESDARALGIWSDQYGQQVRADFNRFEMYKDQLRCASEVEKLSEKRTMDVIPGFAELIDNLGDESDLATLQAIALQNQTQLNQMENLVQMQNQMLTNVGFEQAERAAGLAKWRDAEIKRLQTRQPTELLGRDRWGSF